MEPIEKRTFLRGVQIELRPMEPWHFEELSKIGEDKSIWTFYPTDMSTKERRFSAFEHALSERENGTQFPFVIFHKPSQQLLGSTRLMDIVPEHNKLEIGWTWLQADAWGTAVNPECKFLLLSYCFEKLGVNRVQLRTDENNQRSRAAIAKLGAQFEGINRQDRIRDNGTLRNTACYSILPDEWPEVKRKLQQRMNILETI